MDHTLVVYESRYGTAKRTAEAVGRIIGNTKVKSITEAPKEISVYQNIVLVFGFYGNETLQAAGQTINKIKSQLKDKKIAAVGVGLEERDLQRYQGSLEKVLGRKADGLYFVQGELHCQKLCAKDQQTLKSFCQKVGMPLQDMGNWQSEQAAAVGEALRKQFYRTEHPMPKEALKQAIEAFIKQHNMMALTTGSGSQVRCSPVEYIYEDGCFYVITEGGLKFRGFLSNPQVSVGIYDTYSGMGELGGLQITATAEEVPYLSETYQRIIAYKKVTPAILEKMPVTLYMLQIKPSHIEFLYSPLKKQGYDSKQLYECH